jgi:hypothetical protein
LLSVGPPTKAASKTCLLGASWEEKPAPTALVFPAKILKIGSPNVRSTIDSGHWEKLKLFVFPSSFSINLHQLSFHKEICKTRLEASNDI